MQSRVLVTLGLLVAAGCGYPGQSAPVQPTPVQPTSTARRRDTADEPGRALPTTVLRAMIRNLGPPPAEPLPPPCSSDVRESFQRWLRGNLQLMHRLYRCPDLQQVTGWTTLLLDSDADGVIFGAVLVRRAGGAPLHSSCPGSIFVGQRIRCVNRPLHIAYPVHPCFGLGPDGVCR